MVKLYHGGQLALAAEQFGFAQSELIDLSTGINPQPWPVCDIPATCWQRLPDYSAGFYAAAHEYYQTSSLLAVAGSQAAIQALPLLRPRGKVAVLDPMYAEHAYCWHKAGHEIARINALVSITETSALIDQALSNNNDRPIDVLLLTQPNNPTGHLFARDDLLRWRDILAQRGGWLIIDEAYIDTQVDMSFCPQAGLPGLIILRSMGKFFGFAGARVGFVAAEKTVLQQLDHALGPWALSHPAQYLAELALKDVDWQQQTKVWLKVQSKKLYSCLQKLLLEKDRHALIQGSDFFQTIFLHNFKAYDLYNTFGHQGIVIRHFQEHNLIRLGLPANDEQWQRFFVALKSL